MASVAIVNPTQSIAPDVNIVSPKNNDTSTTVPKIPKIPFVNKEAIVVDNGTLTTKSKHNFKDKLAIVVDDDKSNAVCISGDGKAKCDCGKKGTCTAGPTRCFCDER